MARKRDSVILFIFGLILTILGTVGLFMYHILEKNLIIGNVIINTNNTGIFLVFIGILSLLIAHSTK